jgi:hypothetical protein
MSAFLHPFTPPRMTEFVTIVGGEGSEVWDTEGNRYIDGMASLWYMNVGHGHPRMIEAITAQAKALASYHTFAPFSNRPAEQLADTILELSPFDRGSRVPGVVGIGGRGQRDEDRPDRPAEAGHSTQDDDREPRTRVSRHELRRDLRAGHRPPTRRASANWSATSSTSPGWTSSRWPRIVRRAWRRDRRRALRAAAGCRRGVSSTRGLSRGPACIV